MIHELLHLKHHGDENFFFTAIFNWRIVMAKTSIIDYVVVHELCHLKHKNHSKEYWDSIKTVMPNYKERKEWLRVNGKLLSI